MITGRLWWKVVCKLIQEGSVSHTALEDGVILDFAGPSCVSIDDFAFGAVARYIQINKDKVVVDFTASWCGPCRFISPFLAELAKKFPNVMFLKVDVDELKEVAAEWDVDAMPTFLFLKEGKAVEKVVGAKKEELQQAVTKHMATSSTSA
ncbi:hypothetical protein ES288_A11G203500v1 [Gossypium darwinii]|nr:hypothetical protein ES288_A11G203500v1 [Gossypium darwinii]